MASDWTTFGIRCLRTAVSLWKPNSILNDEMRISWCYVRLDVRAAATGVDLCPA